LPAEDITIGKWIFMTKPCQYNVKENWTLVNEKTIAGQVPLSKIVLTQDTGKNILLRDY
jgi:hypothetical protein